MGVKSAVVAFVSRVCIASLVIASLASSEGCRSSSAPPRAVSAGLGTPR